MPLVMALEGSSNLRSGGYWLASLVQILTLHLLAGTLKKLINPPKLYPRNHSTSFIRLFEVLDEKNAAHVNLIN